MILWLANHLWQSTLYLAAAALIVRLLKQQDARWRYAIWLSASFKFLVPFAVLMAIGGTLPRPAVSSVPTVTVSVMVHAIGEPFAPGPPVQAAGLSGSGIAALALSGRALPIVAIWAIGALLLAAARLVRGRAVRQALRSAVAIHSGREFDALERMRATLQLRRPVALRSSESWLEPAVIGLLRPVIVWPAALTPRLTDDELDAIFAHELLHVRRRDNLALAVHALTRTLFWFHPALWWLEARLVHERERACDEAVLQLRNEPYTYARSILKVCNFCLRLPGSAAAGVTGAANLTQRVEDIMKPRTIPSLNVIRKALLVLTAVVVVAAPIAAGAMREESVSAALPEITAPADAVAATPLPAPTPEAAGQTAVGHVSGVVTDQRGDPIADAEIQLSTDPKAPRAAVTDAAGRYSLDLPPGQYNVRVQKAGFESSQTTIFINRGASLERDVQLRVGSVTELLNVVGTSDLERTKSLMQQGRYAEAEAVVDSALAQANRRNADLQRLRTASAQNSSPALAPVTAVRVGGEIAPPKRIHDVPPMYPPDARANNISGVVIIDATIGTDGSVKDARVLRGVEPLNQAALDAVTQWRYTPTTLNGAPVEVMMTVTVSFQLQ